MESSMSGLSIYQASRSIKKRDNSLYNALRSIYDDSIFVREIAQLWPELPVLANLRCGLWYTTNFHSTCYFKSTDGHSNNWSFNTSRLNLHVAQLAGQKGGCMIIDSTRKGKRFPDSMSKTIPIWTCVLNRAIRSYRMRNSLPVDSTAKKFEEYIDASGDIGKDDSGWDCSLHLPLWVSDTEKALIESRLEGWRNDLETSGADIATLASSLKKPLRPLWISPKTVIWLNEVPESDSWDFTPIILVSASSSTCNFHQRITSEFSWTYIAGAGDDEESWARGLSPELFWKHAYDIISSGPNICNQKVADIVEKNRVYRSQRGEVAPQVSIKQKTVQLCDEEVSRSSNLLVDREDLEASTSDSSISWLGSTKLAVGSSQSDIELTGIDGILNCCKDPPPPFNQNDPGTYLHLPVVGSKFDRLSLARHLPSALDFAKKILRKGKTLLICCGDGEDISICVCLAVLTSLFDDKGEFDDGRSFNMISLTKLDLRRKLVYVCKFVVNARPSRGNLRQVFGYLSDGSRNEGKFLRVEESLHLTVGI